MSEVTGKALDMHVLRRLLRYARPYTKVFIATFVLTLVLAVLSPMRPWLIQYTFDHYISIPDPDGLLRMTAVLIITLFLEAALYYFYTFSANLLGQSVVRDLRVELFKHINRQRLRYFDQTPIGTLVTRAISDMETIADIFSDGVLIIFGDVLKLVAVMCFMLYIDVKLTLLSLSSIPVLLFATWVFKNGIQSTFQEVRTQVARLNAFLQEHITGMHIVQIFNREGYEMERFREINAQHRDANVRSVWYYSIFLPVVEILSAVSIAVIVWWGADQVLEAKVNIGHLVAFILYIHMMFRPIRELADKFNTLQMGMVSSERVFKVLDTEEPIIDQGTLHTHDLKGAILFDHVWFAYAHDDFVLKDVSFAVRPGETLALVGATGSGKTSIINLLSRFYEFNKGDIRVDGRSIRDYDLNSLRSGIGVVLQDVFLFSDTIYRNITLGDPNIPLEKAVAAAKEFGAHDFIMELPGGYDFNVRERGGMLSVGQRQLISFVRAYVHNPRILVLDEATSSIDTESEIIIEQAIRKLISHRTSIIIAHRLATVQRADRIIVMDGGKVKEMGTHNELMALNGHYRNLFELQFASV